MEHPTSRVTPKKTSFEILEIALIVVLFWIGVWGLFDTLLQEFIKGSLWNAIGIYSALILFVILLVQRKPHVLEHFI